MTRPASFAPGKTGESSALPSSRLIGLHRHSLTNVLVVGGNAVLRDQVARAFHRESPLGGGAFVTVDCSRDGERLRLALQGWTSPADAPGVNPLAVAERGTLYLDQVEQLDLDVQRLLLALTRAMQADAGLGSQGPRAGRLVVGNIRPLAEAVAEGRFIAGLYDALDKVRVELGPESSD